MLSRAELIFFSAILFLETVITLGIFQPMGRGTGVLRQDCAD